MNTLAPRKKKNKVKTIATPNNPITFALKIFIPINY